MRKATEYGTPGSIPLDRSARHYDRRHRRIARWAFVASVLFHAAVLFWFRDDIVIPQSPFAAAGPRAGDARAAAGGGQEVVTLRVTAPEIAPVPVVPKVEPVPTPEPEKVEVEPEIKVAAAPATATVETLAGTGQASGNTAGAGVTGGTGRGDGGNSAEGLFRVIPPSPRGLILPPSDRPGKVRGKEVDVWVFVDARGRVVGDSTRVAPTSGDNKFDDRLREQAAEWVFEPARRGGRAVAEWFRYTIIL
ncbi:MAG: hypothetical protein L0271_08455 [Gemmatimonadetes bacterium]|nr:hypothetical protein [Gemmatimonadota bacterium]